MRRFSFCDLKKNLCDLTDTIALTRHQWLPFYPALKHRATDVGVDSFFWHLTIKLPLGVVVRVFIIGVETAGYVIALTGNSWVRNYPMSFAHCGHRLFRGG